MPSEVRARKYRKIKRPKNAQYWSLKTWGGGGAWPLWPVDLHLLCYYNSKILGSESFNRWLIMGMSASSGCKMKLFICLHDCYVTEALPNYSKTYFKYEHFEIFLTIIK